MTSISLYLTIVTYIAATASASTVVEHGEDSQVRGYSGNCVNCVSVSIYEHNQSDGKSMLFSFMKSSSFATVLTSDVYLTSLFPPPNLRLTSCMMQACTNATDQNWSGLKTMVVPSPSLSFPVEAIVAAERTPLGQSTGSPTTSNMRDHRRPPAGMSMVRDK